ncbi:MAG TPA: cell division protein FtsZ [Holosporales bacterium]|nr:cell division protein FtsZ [Holosporales bacterium]
MSQNFENLKPKIVVIGVGGAGGNAVNNMIRSNLEGVEFSVANTDSQALHHSLASTKIQLGYELTQGLGAGSKPDVGCAAAEETLGEIETKIKGSHMVFITAGMGGGTGTGAAPVIAKAARNAGILTVAVVTKPFLFEGAHRMRAAEVGLKELQKHVDTLIIIPNQNLFRLADTKTTFADAFNMADNVLYSGVRGVTDLMIMPGLINLDFADVRTVMSEMGKAMMGTGEAEGENRALAAAEAAVANPLLDEVSLKGANGVLINITGGMDMTLFEVDEAANYIREQVDKNANIIFGSTFDDRLEGRIRVSVVATGIEDGNAHGGRLSRDMAKDFLASPLPQTQLDFEEEEMADLNPLSLGTEDDILVTTTPPLTTEEGTTKRSFWERIGLKKTKEDTPRPELVLSQNDEQNPGPIADDTPDDEDEDLDVPTFLRQRKPQ